ncbi:hypothetical protein Hanom_Chr08g00689531 [Helianthus anomalus]
MPYRDKPNLLCPNNSLIILFYDCQSILYIRRHPVGHITTLVFWVITSDNDTVIKLSNSKHANKQYQIFTTFAINYNKFQPLSFSKSQSLINHSLGT